MSHELALLETIGICAHVHAHQHTTHTLNVLFQNFSVFYNTLLLVLQMPSWKRTMRQHFLKQITSDMPATI